MEIENENEHGLVWSVPAGISSGERVEEESNINSTYTWREVLRTKGRDIPVLTQNGLITEVVVANGSKY